MIEQPPQCNAELKKPREQQTRHQNAYSVAEPTKQYSGACEGVIVVDSFADIDDNDIWLKTCMQNYTIHCRQETAHCHWLTA